MIAEINARSARDRRAAQDARYLPGGSEDVFARITYWEEGAARFEELHDQADQHCRLLRARCKGFPWG